MYNSIFEILNLLINYFNILSEKEEEDKSFIELNILKEAVLFLLTVILELLSNFKIQQNNALILKETFKLASKALEFIDCFFARNIKLIFFEEIKELKELKDFKFNFDFRTENVKIKFYKLIYNSVVFPLNNADVYMKATIEEYMNFLEKLVFNFKVNIKKRYFLIFFRQLTKKTV